LIEKRAKEQEERALTEGLDTYKLKKGNKTLVFKKKGQD